MNSRFSYGLVSVLGIYTILITIGIACYFRTPLVGLGGTVIGTSLIKWVMNNAPDPEG